MSRLKFGWQIGSTLTYGAYQEDGTEITAAGASLPESGTAPGYFTVIDAAVGLDDVVVVKEGSEVVGFGETVSAVGYGAGIVESAGYVGDYKMNETLYFTFSTSKSYTAAGALRVFKNNETSPLGTAQATLDRDIGSEVNIHSVSVVITEANYDKQTDYSVVISGATIGGETITAVVGTFSVENRWQSHRHRYIAD